MKISIALCTFNGERYLSEQLESLGNQIRQPDELVICDDGSHDGTASIIEEFSRRARFKVAFQINRERRGVTANFSRAFSLCCGDLILPCDQDDIWEPDKLTVLESYFVDDLELLLAFSDLSIMASDGRPTGETQWQRSKFRQPLRARVNQGRGFELLLKQNVVAGAAMAFRSSVRDKVLPIPPSFFHDEWIALVVAATGKMLAVDTPLVRYRQHSHQLCGSAPTDLIAQYQYARAKMDRAYFLRMADCARDLSERLSDSEALLDSRYLSLVQAKLSHARTRIELRERIGRRWPLAIGEAARGRYGKFGYGFKSFLQDLFI